MVKKRFLLGILVLALVFGMMVVGCGGDDDTGEDTQPEPGETVDNPVDRIADTNLGTMTSSASGWQQLLNSINSTGKYINLDLSACTMTGTSFNPNAAVGTGKTYIVSIILPTVATSIEAGTYSDPTFKDFNNLKSISGANVTSIGDYSFPRYSRLKNVDFPLATTIGESAFEESNYLESMNFPLVQSIGRSAFFRCENLESISFPASAELGLYEGNYSNPFSYCEKLTFSLTGTGSLSVIENGKALVRDSTILLAYPSASGNITMNNITALDGGAFQGRSQLTSVSLPQVTSIGRSAFAGCINIQDVSFPAATSIGSGAFVGCSRLQSADFPLVTTIGSDAFRLCSNLVILNIPKVTKIERSALSSTGDTTLSISMGSSAPTLDYGIFINSSDAKTVTVKVPSGASGYSPFSGTAVTVSSGTNVNWANGLRGGGWNGTTWASTIGDIYINQDITVIIQQQ